jgi:hypothetical protein
VLTWGRRPLSWVSHSAKTAPDDVVPGPVPDQEPEVRGDPQDVHVTGADLHDEQAVQAPQGHRAGTPMIMMPYDWPWPWPSPQITGRADFWHHTPL